MPNTNSPTASLAASQGRSQSTFRRIVLYGRPASGKTCLLAALAMPRRPHSSGCSIVWVCDSQTVRLPDGPRERWDPSDPAVSRYLGKEWLQRAIDAISGGAAPRATPNDAAPFRLLFDLTEPSGRIHRIEMVDYSGELVNPNLSDDALAKQLMFHLEEADGILVLAEAPAPGAARSTAFRELQVLQQAFMLVSAKRRAKRQGPFPVAMLINKWDRLSRMERFDPAVAAMEIEEFMREEPPVPQAVLFNVIKAVAGCTEERVFARAFAVSALGRMRQTARVVDGVEHIVDSPVIAVPLESYGLEEPLVWISECADARAYGEVANAVRALSPWKPWQLASGAATAACKGALDLQLAYPAGSAQAQEVSRLRLLAANVWSKQVLAAVLSVVAAAGVCFQSWRAISDASSFRRATIVDTELAAGADPSSIEHLRESADFLAEMSTPSLGRMLSYWFVASSSTAGQMHGRLASAVAAADHINSVLAEYRTKLDRITESGLASSELSSVEQALGDLEAVVIPQVEHAVDRLTAHREDCTGRMRARLSDLKQQGKASDFTTQFNKRMRDGLIPEAAEAVFHASAAVPATGAALREDFVSNWQRATFVKVTALTREENGWKAIEAMLRRIGEDRNIAEYCGAAAVTAMCAQCGEAVQAYRAQVAYMKFYKDPGALDPREELKLYGSKDHKQIVAAWESYQQMLNTDYEWQLETQRFAISDTGNLVVNPTYDLSISVFVSSGLKQDLLSAVVEDVEDAGHDRVFVRKSGVFKAKPKDYVDFTVTMKYADHATLRGTLRGACHILADEPKPLRLEKQGQGGDGTLTVSLKPVGFTVLKQPQLPQPEEPKLKTPRGLGK